jgi:hypothetical protein
MKLLTMSNPKTAKGESLGYLSFILHLAPGKLSGFQTCPGASAGCLASCLNTSGRGRFTRTQDARIKKTRWFFRDRVTFMAQLVRDVLAAERKARRLGLVPVFRLNGTSDIRWETIPVHTVVMSKGCGIAYNCRNIFEAFPHLTFYDYTKLHNRRNIPMNYHLTFSRSEENGDKVAEMLSQGFNVAALFDSLPETFLGFPVIDGTEHDLRFMDPKGVIVGLVPKGKAKTDDTGFVISLQRAKRMEALSHALAS